MIPHSFFKHPIVALAESFMRIPIELERNYRGKRSTAGGIAQQFSGHAQTERPLPIERAINIEDDQIYRAPIYLIDHAIKIYCWVVKPRKTGMSISVAMTNNMPTNDTSKISTRSLNSFSGF